MSEKIVKEWQVDGPELEEIITNERPLQRAGQDHILREYTLGGPNSRRDVRMILDIETLEILIEIARSSRSKRAIIPSAGINMKVRRASSGHVYETLHIVGGRPVPEKAPTELKMDIPRSQLLGDSIFKKW